jgi:hypothetical protein
MACNGHAEVHLRAEWEAGAPITQLEVTALPFDPDSILDSLAAAARSPQPSFEDLVAELWDYRRPAGDSVDDATRPWRALRDTVSQLADSLNAMDRDQPGYAQAYGRFRQLYARLAQRAADRDNALRQLGGADLDLVRRATVAAESLRTWEYGAYADYPDVAAAKVAEADREVVDAVTDSSGAAVLELASGRWWLIALLPDPDNPFLEYYWNVPVTATRLVPVRLPLNPGNSTRRWRH